MWTIIPCCEFIVFALVVVYFAGLTRIKKKKTIMLAIVLITVLKMFCCYLTEILLAQNHSSAVLLSEG